MFCKQSFLEIKSKIKKLDKRFLNLIKELLIEKRYPGEGNPVIPVLTGKIGDGPAAVVPPFSEKKKGTLSAHG